MLHEAPCPLMTLSNHHGSTTGSPKTTRVSSISYELSEDLRAKEIEFMERCYGGRIKAHRAARIIQTAYRNYRINKDYCRLRNEQRMSRRLDSIYCDSTPKHERISPIHHEKLPLNSTSQGTNHVYKDYGIEKVYQSWDEEIKKLNINRDSLESQNDTPNSSISSSNLGESIKSVKDFDQSLPCNSSDQSEMVTSPGKSSGFISNNSPDTTGSFSLNDSYENTDFNYSPIHNMNPTNSAPNSSQILLPNDQHQHQQHSNSTTYKRQKTILYSPQRLTAIPISACNPNMQLSPPSHHNIVYLSPSKSTASSSVINAQYVTMQGGGGQQASITSVHHHKAMALNKAQTDNQNKKRKRLYRIGLNIFNKSPVKGVEFLTKLNFIESTPIAIAKFLLTRRGLSRVAIGDYLGNSQDKLASSVTKYFIGSIDFRGKELDQALRIMFSYFRTPGESQKIQHLLTEFQTVYIQQNPELFRARFRTEDMVMVTSYAIIMLHTDLHTSKIRQQDRMTKDQFIRNLRGCDGGEDVNNEFLGDIFDRIQAEEMRVQADHTELVRKIESTFTGPLRPRNVGLPQRRLVCYCSLFEVMDKNKRDKLGSHERDVFLFNDLLVITKRVQKKRKDFVYSVKWCVDLLGLQVVSFENPNYPNGIELINGSYIPALNSSTSLTSQTANGNGSMNVMQTNPVNICLNTKTPADKASFLADLHESILEVTEMDRIRISDGITKMNLPQRSMSQSNQHNNQINFPPRYAYQMPVTGGDIILCNQQQPATRVMVPANVGNYILIPTSSMNNFVTHSGQSLVQRHGPVHISQTVRGIRRVSGQNP